MDLEYENLGAIRFVLRYRHEISIEFRNQARSFPKRSGGNGSKLLIVVRVRLLINIGASVAGSINTFTGGVVLQIIDAFGNWQCRDFLSGLSVHYRNLPAAASHK